MPDKRFLVDYAALGTFTEVPFGFEATTQAFLNKSSTDTVEISWNGADVHDDFVPNQPDEGFTFTDHKRHSVWVRRQGGAGAGSHILEITVFR